MPTKKNFTISEAAKKLHVTRAAIHAAVKDGRLPATWTTVSQTIKKRALVISAKALSQLKIDKAQQRRGKKN
jgi:hypothetical protein